MSNYLDILSANRTGGPEHAATAKPRSRFRKKAKKVASLTAASKRAKLRVKRVATKPPGKESRGTTKKTPSEKAKMAKKSKRSKKRRSAAQRAATAKMLRANKAKRSGKRRKSSGRKARKARKSSGKRKSAKRVAAGKKAARTRKRRQAGRRGAGVEVGKRKSRKKRSKARKSGRSTKSVKVVRLPRKASRVVVVSAPAKPTRGRRRKSSGKRRARRSRKYSAAAAKKAGWGGGHKRRKYNRRAAMENPMDGTELFIGAVTGLAGFLTADVVDRFLATHALTGTAPGPFTDTPPTTGDYAGLFNATAICAPMNATRWLAGLGVATVPLVIAHFISAPKGRAALQFFGYAAGIRIVGKGLVDAVAMLVQPTMIGQQLYDGEMRASALKTGQGTMPAGTVLPSAGLGRARLGAGKPCAPCASKQVTTGAGYPSAPRQITPDSGSNVAPTPATQNQPTATPPSPPATTVPTATATPPAPPAGPNQLFGPRRSNGIPRRDPNWGYKGDAE